MADEFLLGEAHPALLDNGLQRMWDTAVALVFLALTLPFTLLIGLLALLTTGRMFKRVERLGTTDRFGGRRPFAHFASHFPLCDSIPAAQTAVNRAWQPG